MGLEALLTSAWHAAREEGREEEERRKRGGREEEVKEGGEGGQGEHSGSRLTTPRHKACPGAQTIAQSNAFGREGPEGWQHVFSCHRGASCKPAERGTMRHHVCLGAR